MEIPSESPECRAVQSWNSIFYLFFLYGFLWNFDGGLERGGTQKGRGGGWHFNVVNIYIYTTAKFLRVPPTEIRASSNSFFSCGSFARCFATSLLIIFECSCHAHASCRWCREECGARFCYWPWSFAFIYLPVRFFLPLLLPLPLRRTSEGGREITQDTWMPFAFECYAMAFAKHYIPPCNLYKKRKIYVAFDYVDCLVPSRFVFFFYILPLLIYSSTSCFVIH